MTAPDHQAGAGPQETTRARVVPPERDHLRAGVGEILKRERRAAGLTQCGLADLAGLSLATVTELERGTVRPSEGTTRLLARALRPGSDPVAVAELDGALLRAGGPALRGW